MKHKILFFMGQFPHLGGVGKVSLQLALAFREAGHDVCFLSWQKVSPEAQISWKETEGFDVTYLPDSQQVDSAVNQVFIKQFVAENDIDILLNQGADVPLYRLFGKEDKCRVVNVLHGDPDWLFMRRRLQGFPAGSWKPSRWKSLLRYLYIKLFPALSDKRVKKILREDVCGAAAYVVLHPSFVDKILNYTKLEAAAKRLTAIPNPVWPSSLQTKAEKILLYAGRFTRSDKRLDRLLRIWAKVQHQLPDWELRLVGDGPDKHNLQEMSNRLGLERVSFLPPVWDERLYAEASLALLTSVYEGQSLSMMEAQQAGVVPLAFEVNASMRDLFQQGKSGILVPAFDEEAYAQALIRICQDDALRFEMSRCAREHMKSYHISVVLPQWLQLFDRISPRQANKNDLDC